MRRGDGRLRIAGALKDLLSPMGKLGLCSASKEDHEWGSEA